MDAKIIPLGFNKIFTQKITADWLDDYHISLDVLRLDVLHPVVSGNKWFKLKYYLQEAKRSNKNTIATFGGAYSNHIIATAFACKEHGLNSIGFIRGDEVENLSHTLSYATQLGMELKFVSREEYRDKNEIINKYTSESIYWIHEGGYGTSGALGASEILQYAQEDYSHIIPAIGTGTLLAGLINAANDHQQIIGISSMKGNQSLTDAVKKLLAPDKLSTSFEIIHDYHFGGYGKHPSQLISYMNEIYRKHQLPLDIIYTSKTFYAIEDLAKKNYFKKGSRLLMIHSGGLQGNQSLPAGLLSFL